jgi:hypothetical protein
MNTFVPAAVCFHKEFLGVQRPNEQILTSYVGRYPVQINYTKGTTVHQTCLVSPDHFEANIQGGGFSTLSVNSGSANALAIQVGAM